MESAEGGLSSKELGFTMTDDEWYYSRLHLINRNPPIDPNERTVITRPVLGEGPTSIDVSIFVQKHHEYLSILHNYEKLKSVIVDVFNNHRVNNH